MADRSAAALFSNIFETLAGDKGKMTAEYFWKESHSYDFHPYQMDCDDALVKLKLALQFTDEFDGNCTVYANRDASDWDIRGLSQNDRITVSRYSKPLDYTDYAAKAGVSL